MLNRDTNYDFVCHHVVLLLSINLRQRILRLLNVKFVALKVATPVFCSLLATRTQLDNVISITPLKSNNVDLLNQIRYFPITQLANFPHEARSTFFRPNSLPKLWKWRNLNATSYCWACRIHLNYFPIENFLCNITLK